MELVKSSQKNKRALKPVKYHREQFEKINDEKRSRIIDAALAEFSSMGYNAANINVIAKKAGISIGSMYQYFESKENLFLTIMDEAYRVIEGAISRIENMDGSVFDKLDQIIRYVQKYSREYKLLNQVYLEATTQGLAQISKKLSNKMETISSAYYKTLLNAAVKDGTADSGISIDTAAFCIDNIILLLQFSYSSAYFAERMKIFAGKNSHREDDRIREEIMYLLKKALSPEKK